MRLTATLTAMLLLLAGCATTTTTDATMAGALPESDIAAIVNTANEGEIQQGNAAASRATSADVRAFAQMMVADHTTALSNARTVFSANNITPADNDTSRTLRAESQRTVTNLATYSGAAFDRTYMRTQVDLHQWLLTSLDTVLIPSARTPAVRELLQTQRGSVAAHLERARTILGGL
jgi:putative membrane protein